MTTHTTILKTEPMNAAGVLIGHGNVLDEYVSEEVYWEEYYSETDTPYEWNNGRLEALPMSNFAEYMVYLWFLDVLRDFLHVSPMARIMGLELGFRMALPNKVVIRKPDLGVVLHTNPIPLRDHDQSYRGIFDICIESLSTGSKQDIRRDTITKRDEYAAGGVQEYYILDERGIETEFYELTPGGVYRPLPRQGGVVRSGVLPGFQFRESDLYTRPLPPELIDDPVYSSFISPYYRSERQRAEQAYERAEQEHERAEQEHERAERYAAMLRAAGLLN